MPKIERALQNKGVHCAAELHKVLSRTGCYSHCSLNRAFLLSSNIPRRWGGNLLPINVRIKLLKLGQPRQHPGELCSPWFYTICFHWEGKKNKRKKPEKERLIFFPNVFTEGIGSLHSWEVLFSSIFPKGISWCTVLSVRLSAPIRQ